MVVENVLRTAVMDKGELKLKIANLDIHENRESGAAEHETFSCNEKEGSS